MSLLQNKNCLITGSYGKLGNAIANELVRHGTNLYLTSRSESKLNLQKENLLDLCKDDQEIYCMAGDLNSDSDINKIIENVLQVFGSLDILVNNAGVFHVKNITETSTTDFDECINVNVRAPFIFTREFVKGMMKNKWGRIVNICSSSSYQGFKRTSAYSTSKHALLGLSRSLQDELKEFNIRTFSISPGSIKTEMGRKVVNQNYESFIEPDEIASYISFIISFDGEMIIDESRINRMIVE